MENIDFMEPLLEAKIQESFIDLETIKTIATKLQEIEKSIDRINKK